MAQFGTRGASPNPSIRRRCRAPITFALSRLSNRSAIPAAVIYR